MNKEGSFGISYKQMKKKYFKEYQVELYGKDSPGPAKYEVAGKDFEKPRHSCKSMTRERRECPIVPKHTINEHVSPFSYNINPENFSKVTHTKFFGTKAPRRVDFRKCKFNVSITLCSWTIERKDHI